MISLDKDIKELEIRLKDGSIQRAYKWIVSYMSRLRAIFANKFIERAVSGLYQGYFDMTYFALFSDMPKSPRLTMSEAFLDKWKMLKEYTHKQFETISSRRLFV
jgi:hypothetical protein